MSYGYPFFEASKQTEQMGAAKEQSWTERRGHDQLVQEAEEGAQEAQQHKGRLTLGQWLRQMLKRTKDLVGLKH